jgi:hypothetical protein
MRPLHPSKGCFDALVVWDGTLLDAHSLSECCALLDIPSKTVEATVQRPDIAAEPGQPNASPRHRRWISRSLPEPVEDEFPVLALQVF